MIALYPLIKQLYSLYRYFSVPSLFYFSFLSHGLFHTLSFSPMFFHALSRIFDSSYRMISIHGFFGSRYLFSTGGATVTTRTVYLICTNLPHQSMPRACPHQQVR
jgi:hypothetical protein